MQAILFDNDGVLVDTEQLYFETTRDALAPLGVVLDHDVYRALSLEAGRSCFDLAREAGAPEAAIAERKRERDERYRARVLAGVPLIEGVRETLALLAPRHRLAIVTSSLPENLHAMHAHHALDGFFELVVASGDYARSKPHPDPYLEAASRLGVRASDCLVVEDSERGLRAALAAGMECVVIPHALTRGSDFRGAARVLSSVREVPLHLAAR